MLNNNIKLKMNVALNEQGNILTLKYIYNPTTKTDEIVNIIISHIYLVTKTDTYIQIFYGATSTRLDKTSSPGEHENLYQIMMNTIANNIPKNIPKPASDTD